MNANKSRKSNRINIVRPVYSMILEDGPSGTTYGEVKSLGKAMQVQVTPAVAAGVLYGDGAQEENIGKLTGISVVIDVNKIFIESRAEIMGNTYKDGVLMEQKGDEPKDIALGYEVEQTGGTREQVWLLKGKAKPINQTIQQSTDNLVFSTDSITIDFIPRESDGSIRYYADTANADYTEEQAKKFFSEGPSSYPMPVQSS